MTTVTRTSAFIELTDAAKETNGMVNTLEREEIYQLFESARIARLGFVANGEPYVVPMNYEFHDGAVYCHSLPGLKITALRENRRACVQVDEIETNLRWRSAIAFGVFEEVTDEKERQQALTALMDRYPMMTPVEWGLVHDADLRDVIVFRIRIDRLTGVAGE